jgi:hypothetical protein
MITRIGANTDGAVGHLLGDFINPVFAYSLNRKLRNFYTGEYFRFKDKNGEGDYPSTTPDMSEDVELLKIYDQKEKFGYNKEDAVATGTLPKLKFEDGLYRAVFSGSEYMSIGSADAIGGHFNIILVAKGDYPRPAFGMWGDNDAATIEPSTEGVAKFTVNRNRGAMKKSETNCYSCFYGFDPAQQDRVMSFNSDGHNVEADTTESFSDIAIGRMRERYYIGEVLELVGYIQDLKLKWHDTLHRQLETIYESYT